MHTYPSNWEDMSNYLVHFTEGNNGTNDYGNMMGIYGDGCLKPEQPFGIGKTLSPSKESQLAVCFSEIPPGQWQRLKDRRKTKYGIAFTKAFVLSEGGEPIWYVWKESPHWTVLQNMMGNATSTPDADIWKLTPLIDAPGEYLSRPYFFDWEREWRHIGTFSFEPDDVAFLLIPENLHDAARTFFQNALGENTGPAYLCPYVDPTWERERILKAIREPEGAE